MIHILFIDDIACSSQNGIGTFRDELLKSLTAFGRMRVSLISMNSEVSSIETYENKGLHQIKLPRFGNGKWRQCGGDIASVLRSEVVDSKENIFVLNYSPCSEFIAELKLVFPLSRWVFVIHDQGWCAPLLGDVHLLTDIINGKNPDIVSAKTMEYVRDYCSKELAIYNEVDKVVCLSQSTYNVLLQVYKVPPFKPAIISNGINSGIGKKLRISKEQARIKLGLKEKDTIIVSVGRPVRHKGINVLMLAMQLMIRKHSEIKFVLAGNSNAIKQHLSVFPDIEPNIILPGYLDAEELSLLYSAADVGVISSYTEQCSYAALEMMNAGLPIVTSDGFGLCDMFADGENAFVAHIGNVTEVKEYAKRLSFAIERALIASDTIVDQYSQFNQKMLSDRYSAFSMALAYEDMFNSLIY